jgi:hypothetical protein
VERYLIALACLLFAPFSRSEIPPVLIEIECGTEKDVTAMLTLVGEVPFIKAVSTNTDGEKVVLMPTILFVNPKTRTWSLIQKHADDKFCLVASGTNVALRGESSI